MYSNTDIDLKELSEVIKENENFQIEILQHLKEFDEIWINYCNILPVQANEFDFYVKVIIKIRNDDINFSYEDKKIFLELIELISECIYRYRKYNDKFNKEEYAKENIETELKCCNVIKKYLELDLN